MECKYVFDDKKVNKFSHGQQIFFCSINWLSWIHFRVKASHNLSFQFRKETKRKQHHLVVDCDLENC